MIFDLQSLSLIAAIVFLDSVLSIDNALANAAIAQKLPPHQRTRAIQLGLLLGLVFRLIALVFISFIIAQPLIRLLGACYLLYLVWDHFKGTQKEHGKSAAPHLRAAVIAIGLTDIAFSIDNIVAAIGLSTNITIVAIGVFGSIIVMMFATQMLEVLMRRYRALIDTAFIILALIGISIIVDSILLFIHTEPLEITPILKLGIIASLIILAIVYEEIVRLRTR